MADECDVVVIGAGHNGLVAANYLCDAGFSVVVVEANDRVGGMTSTSASIAAAPNHLINNFSVDSFFWDSFPPSRELDLHRHGLNLVEFDPGHLYLHPEGGSIAFYRDASRTADDIRRFSPNDARAYLDLVPKLQLLSDLAMRMGASSPGRPDLPSVGYLIRRIAKSRNHFRDLIPLALGSISEVIGERFSHQVVRDALHASSGSTIPNDISGTGVALVWIGNMHSRTCRRPIGGVQAIPDALVRRLVGIGGSVRTGAPVTEILRDDEGAAVGVRMVDGTSIHARRAVLGCCDPRTTLEKLLPSGALSDEMAATVRNIPVDNLGYGQMKVDLALSGRTSMRRHQAWRRDDLDVRNPTHMIGTEAGMRRTFARSAAGLLPEAGEHVIWPVIPTAIDPSQAPSGMDTVYLYASVVPMHPAQGWSNVKNQAAEGLIRTASMYYDDLDVLEVGRQVLVNDDIADITHATGGNITHVDTVLSRFGPLRPARGLGGYATPVPGLYLGGAGSHPGGGITGGPGYVSARTIIRALSGESSHRWRKLAKLHPTQK